MHVYYDHSSELTRQGSSDEKSQTYVVEKK